MTSPSGPVVGDPKAPFAMSHMAQLNENLHRTGLTGCWTIPRAGGFRSVSAVHSTFGFRAHLAGNAQTDGGLTDATDRHRGRVLKATTALGE